MNIEGNFQSHAVASLHVVTGENGFVLHNLPSIYHIWGQIEAIMHIIWILNFPKRFLFSTSDDLSIGNLSALADVLRTTVYDKICFHTVRQKMIWVMTTSKFDLLFDLVTSSMTSWVRDM